MQRERAGPGPRNSKRRRRAWLVKTEDSVCWFQTNAIYYRKCTIYSLSGQPVFRKAHETTQPIAKHCTVNFSLVVQTFGMEGKGQGWHAYKSCPALLRENSLCI